MVWTRAGDLRVVGDRQGTPLPEGVGRDLAVNGLTIPLLATDGEPRAVVLGTRRAAALKVYLGKDVRVPVLVASRSSEVAEWLRTDQALYPDGLPWSWVQRARVYGWIVRDVSVRNGEPSVLGALAAYLQVHEIQLRNAWYLVRDFDRATGDKKVHLARAIQAVESGTLKPQSAYGRLKEGGFPDPDAPPPPPSLTPAQQRKALESLGHTLAGLSLGIDSLGVVSPLAPGDPALVPLVKFRRQITRLVRALASGDTHKE